jgi:CRISPR-associated endoribonuclease Cas6
MILSLSYNHFLASIVYHIIKASSPAYASFLHERGYNVDGSLKRFKHFTFSRLAVPKRKIVDEHLHILSERVEWYVSLLVEDALQHFVAGLFEKQEIWIEREENRFLVEQVETLPEPKWERKMRFRMLSPLTVSIPEHRHGRLIPHYLRPDDRRLSDALRSNIINKYRSLFCKSDWQSDLQDFVCTLDEKFISDRGGPENISKLITIKAGCWDETKVRGFMCPLTIEGNPELIKLAYESGLGEKGSLGFGMLEIL